MVRVKKPPMERKAELVETAQELFFKNGYDATAVSDIVKNAGVAQGTFYWYFKSKEEILDAVAEKFAGVIFKGIEKVAEDEDMPADQKIWAIFGAAESSVEKGGKIVEEFHSPKFSRYHDRIARHFLKRLIPVLTKVIYEGREQGIFDTPSPEMAAIFILAPGLYTDEDIPFEGRKSIEHFSDEYMDIIGRVLGLSPERGFAKQ
ncbi:MAG: TetR/AcrR family transcriptional regulator [Actinobacteria bacterium]|nr:TetR/AcrR family transcriptional regulator [Actinomycetota bacterium]